MTVLRHLLLWLLLSAPLAAQNLPGADDPAFQSAWASLLHSDDPAALHSLHALATSGNTAALLALPLAQRWLPPQPDRADLRLIGDARARTLGQSAHNPARLWDDGAISPYMSAQLTRALNLYTLAEPAKADALLAGYVNHLPMTAPLPDDLATLDAAPVLKARLLIEHLTRGNRKALLPLQTLLDQDRIEGWMALAELNDHVPVTSTPPIQANLTLPPNTGQRLAAGRLALRLLWRDEPPPPLPPETLAMAALDLLPRSEFAPVRALCAANCPATTAACEAAFISLIGAPPRSVATATPLAALMTPDAFFATPRGAQTLLATAVKRRLALSLAPDPATSLATLPAFHEAQSLDACFAATTLRALSPLP